MGAGNVKPVRQQPPPLRLPGDAVAIARASKGAIHHISELVPVAQAAAGLNSTNGSSGTSKKWDVTCDIHRGIICRFCGGKSCKREDWTKQEDTPAMQGLHSTWVSANVIGMQRPSTRLIKQFKIVEQFKKAGIGAVINLQLAGEHPHCGDGIDAHGFSYKPEDFTDHGIYYYNPGWVDMDIPTLEKMIEIVQIMQFHSEKSQKIAVHCHAGYGRTGIVIACFFVYAYGLAPEVAIKSVRDRRKGSVQTAKQRKFVAEFHDYVTYLRTVFYPPVITPFGAKHGIRGRNASSGALNQLVNSAHGTLADLSSDDDNLDEDSQIGMDSQPTHAMGTAAGYPGLLFTRRNAALLSAIHLEHESFQTNRFTLHEALSRQRAILHGSERNALKFVPKLIHILCSRLEDLTQHNPFLAGVAFMEGFRKSSTSGGSHTIQLNKAFDEEREKEKERRKLKEKARKGVSIHLNVQSAAHNSDKPSENSSNAVGGVGTNLNPIPLGVNDEGGLASLSAHGGLSNHWDWSNMSQSRTQGSSAPYGNSQVSLEKEESGPKWTAIQDDTLMELKKKINAGEWSSLETCDIRYCAQLLLEWLDTLKQPLLPLFERKDPIIPVGASAAPYNHNPFQLLYTPTSLFQALPRWTLYTIDPLMRMLWNLRGLDMTMLVKIYARFAFALMHPKALLPEPLCVYKTHHYHTTLVLNSKISSSGLSIQMLNQAATAQLVQAQQMLSSATSSAAQKAASMMILKGPPHNFDSVYHMLAAPRSLLDSVVEFLASFIKSWHGMYLKLLYAEERSASNHRIGIRKPETIEISQAQQRRSVLDLNEMDGLGGGAPMNRALGGNGGGLLSYQGDAEPTKLVTQLGHNEATQKDRITTNFHPPEQTQYQEQSVGLNSRYGEVSTTAYLHSHIHHAQPRDPTLEIDRRKLESQLLSPNYAIGTGGDPLTRQDSLGLAETSFDGSMDFLPLGSAPKRHGVTLSQFGADESKAGLGLDLGPEASYLLPSAVEEEGVERLNGFISHRGGNSSMIATGLRKEKDETGDDADGLDRYDEPHTAAPTTGLRAPIALHPNASNPPASYRASNSNTFYPTPGASPAIPDQPNSAPLAHIGTYPSPPPIRHHTGVPSAILTAPSPAPSPSLTAASGDSTQVPLVREPDSPYVQPRAILTKNPAAQVDRPPPPPAEID